MKNNFDLSDYALIDGYENYYVNKHGHVFNTRTGKNLKPQIQRGYAFYTLSKKQKIKRFSSHRLVMLAFCPVDNSDKLCVDHIDSNRSNNHVSNLQWLTLSENTKETVKRGRHTKGEMVAQHKLKEDQVIQMCLEIYEARLNKKQSQGIYKKYGIKQSTACRALNGKVWKHLNANILKEIELKFGFIDRRLIDIIQPRDRKTCSKGHPFVEVKHRNTKRRCKICHNTNQNERKRKKIEMFGKKPDGRKGANTKFVHQYTKSGQYIQTFKSMGEAAENAGVHGSLISSACVGRKKTAGGYKWSL
jgi:hypothetical protein